MRLLTLEIKRCIKNPVFWIVIIIIFVFINSQFAGDNTSWIIEEPIPGRESYGTSTTEDINVIREKSLMHLLAEYSNNSYTTYPYMFYRNIQLNTNKNEAMEKLLSALTGESVESIKSIQSISEEDQSPLVNNEVLFTEKFIEIINSSKINITHKDYLNLMDKIDQLLGGGSPYSEKLISTRFGKIPKTYEEALQDYRDMVYEDKITGAFARLFCDYGGIVLGFLPIFFAVSLWYQDKRNNISHILVLISIKLYGKKRKGEF